MSVVVFSFGITPTKEKINHCGVMTTKYDNCQFVFIQRDDYYRILHEVFNLCLY